MTLNYGKSKARAMAAAGLLLVACSGTGGRKTPESTQAEGNLSASPAPTTMSSCKLPASQGVPECDACLERSCCAEQSVCTADAECSAVFGCLSMCAEHPDPDVCPGRCFGNGAPPALFQSFLDCMIRSCGFECTELSEG